MRPGVVARKGFLLVGAVLVTGRSFAVAGFPAFILAPAARAAGIGRLRSDFGRFGRGKPNAPVAQAGIGDAFRHACPFLMHRSRVRV